MSVAYPGPVPMWHRAGVGEHSHNATMLRWHRKGNTSMSDAVDFDGVLGDDWHPIYSDPIWLRTDEPCECGAQWKPSPEFGKGAREMTHTEACEYMAWANAEEAFYNAEWEIDDADVAAYLAYCSACFVEELDIHTPQQWRIHNRPTGPLG